MTRDEALTPNSARAHLTVLLDSDDPGPALRVLDASVDRRWRRGQRRSRLVRGTHDYSGFELSSSLDETADPSEHAEQLIQRLRPFAPALREIGRHPQTHSIRLTVAEHTLADNPVVALDPAAISFLAAIGASSSPTSTSTLRETSRAT
jgi:Domain of unknown function (DUF4279)